MFILLAFLALFIEALIGYPDNVLRRIGHPVIWIGAFIAFCDRKFNREALPPLQRRLAGAATLFLVVLAAVVPAAVAQHLLLGGPIGLVIAAIAASSLIAQRSLSTHVRDVAAELDKGGVTAGRRAVARIVGRDTAVMKEEDICRAAIESLAENFSDGVVAPAAWLAVAGLPGIAAYKAINTADSMIGHLDQRYRDFGWASARVDDWINLPASRLTGLIVIAAAAVVPGASPGNAWRVMRRDARHHRSPNAGWPEAAFAGALGIALAGPRSYGGVRIDALHIGAEGKHLLDRADVRRALVLYRAADMLLLALCGACAAIAVLMA